MALGGGIYDNRLRIRTTTRSLEGWVSIISSSSHLKLVSYDMVTIQPPPPPRTMMMWEPAIMVFRVGDVCTTVGTVHIRAGEELDSPSLIAMTTGIRVQVLEIGAHDSGRRIKILTHTYQGTMRGWVSVCAANRTALLAPAGASGRAMTQPPTAKRGLESNIETDESFPAARRRRFWY